MAKANGYIIYEGPSAIDGAPIVVIATGFASKSANGKTGDMVQTWILRSDVAPHHAVKTGADASVCGDCVHRPAMRDAVTASGQAFVPCYVKTFQAPLSVFGGYQRGIYPRVTLAQHNCLAALYERRRAKGTYDRELAAMGLLHAVKTGALDYCREFGGRWRAMFVPADRLAVAAALRDDMESEWACGNSWLARAA